MLRRTFLKSTISTVAALTSQDLLFAKIAAAQNKAETHEKALESLRPTLQGPLVLPTDPYFSDFAISANARFNSNLPCAIAFCETPEDVSECIKWSTKKGVPLAAKGGGHNYEGASTTKNGLLIITRRMNKISVDRNKRTLVVQAGVLNGELVQTLTNESLMLPVGTCPQVGVCGLTLGGGIGENSRWAGITSDWLRSTNIVLASGEIITANDSSNRDLFWACRGAGGGNFGIHTELTFELQPLVSDKTSGIYLVYVGKDAAIEVFQTLDELMQTAPNTLNGFIFLTTNPAIWSIPEAITPDVPVGQKLNPARFPITELQLNYQGPLNQLLDLVKVKRLDKKVAVVRRVVRETVESPFWQAQSTWLAVQDQPSHGFASASRFADKALHESAVKDLVEELLNAPFAQRSKNAAVELMCWAGGVVQKFDCDSTAYVHRNSTTIPRVSTWWLANTDKADQKKLLDWMVKPYQLINEVSQNESYQNFPNPLVTDWKTAYYGKNLPHLVRVKRTYDPRNVFQHSQSIPLELY